MSVGPTRDEADASGPQTWVPGDVPASITPPPSAEQLRRDLEAEWSAGRPGEGPAAPGPTVGPPGRASDVAALAVAVAGALALVLGAVVPANQRASELMAGLADPAIGPASAGLGLVLLCGVAAFAWLLVPRPRWSPAPRARRRYRVLAVAWAALAAVLATVRVSGAFVVFGDPVRGALETETSGSVLGIGTAKPFAVGVLWFCVYGLVVAPVVGLVFARLDARGRLDAMEVVLTRSGPAVRSAAQAPVPALATGTVVGDDADDEAVRERRGEVPDDDVPDEGGPDEGGPDDGGPDEGRSHP